MSIKDRVRRLERNADSCPDSSHLKPEAIHVYYPEEGASLAPEPERCPKCDRSLWFVIRVVYEGEGEDLS